MKLALCIALLGLAAIPIVHSQECPDTSAEKFELATKECKESLGIGKGSKAGDGKRQGSKAGGGQRQGDKAQGSDSSFLADGSKLTASGLNDMVSLVRKIRQISFDGKSQKQADQKQKKDEKMKPMADCLDGKLKGDAFYDNVKQNCNSKSPISTNDDQDSPQRCTLKTMAKKCGSSKKSGHGGRGEKRKGGGSDGKRPTLHSAAAVANATSKAVNTTEVTNTTRLQPMTIP